MKVYVGVFVGGLVGGFAAAVAWIWWGAIDDQPDDLEGEDEYERVELEVELSRQHLGHVHARTVEHDYCRACGKDNPRPGELCPDQRRARTLVLEGLRAYPVDAVTS